jgi:hypothetical protein
MTEPTQRGLLRIERETVQGQGKSARAALESDIGRAFELVMNDLALWRRCGRVG